MHAACLEALQLQPGHKVGGGPVTQSGIPRCSRMKVWCRCCARQVGRSKGGQQTAPVGSCLHHTAPGAPTPFGAPPLPFLLSTQFLDAGSGCGLLTAAGAVLVGRSGAAVGFDVRRECVSMGRDAVKRLTSSSPE